MLLQKIFPEYEKCKTYEENYLNTILLLIKINNYIIIYNQYNIMH